MYRKYMVVYSWANGLRSGVGRVSIEKDWDNIRITENEYKNIEDLIKKDLNSVDYVVVTNLIQLSE